MRHRYHPRRPAPDDGLPEPPGWLRCCVWDHEGPAPSAGNARVLPRPQEPTHRNRPDLQDVPSSRTETALSRSRGPAGASYRQPKGDFRQCPAYLGGSGVWGSPALAARDARLFGVLPAAASRCGALRPDERPPGRAGVFGVREGSWPWGRIRVLIDRPRASAGAWARPPD